MSKMPPTRRPPPRSLQAYLAGPPAISQRVLAEAAGCNQSMISMLVRRKRVPSTALAAKLHVITRVPLRALLATKIGKLDMLKKEETCPRCLGVADHSPDDKQCSDNCITRYRARVQELEAEVIGLGKSCAVWLTGDPDDGHELNDTLTAFSAIRACIQAGQESHNKLHATEAENQRLMHQLEEIHIVAADAGKQAQFAWEKNKRLTEALKRWEDAYGKQAALRDAPPTGEKP